MLPAHKWEIAVSAGSYFPDLTQNFFGNDIDLSYENDHMGIQFFAYSRHIDELDSARHVAQRLYSLQLLLNGILRAYWQDVKHHPITFTGFVLCEGGGFGSVHADIIEERPFSQDPEIDVINSAWDDPKQRYPSYLLYLAKKDECLRSILFLLGLISTNSTIEKILTWGTLYKILDCVKHYSKDIGQLIDDFADKAQITYFTAACNNMSILGLYARHGASGNIPPKEVIADISEAVDLIVKMAAKFCGRYVQVKYP
jgi:hypothetical protein